MPKKERESKKYVKTIFDLFVRIANLKTTTLNNFLKISGNRKYLRQSLERMVSRGLISCKKQQWDFTPEGWFAASKINSKARRKLFSKNNVWYVISFDIPITLNTKRNSFRNFLRKYHFFPLQKSVWIGPDQLSPILWKFIVKHRLDKFCRVMQVKIIDGESDIIRHFQE